MEDEGKSTFNVHHDAVQARIAAEVVRFPKLPTPTSTIFQTSYGTDADQFMPSFPLGSQMCVLKARGTPPDVTHTTRQTTSERRLSPLAVADEAVLCGARHVFCRRRPKSSRVRLGSPRSTGHEYGAFFATCVHDQPMKRPADSSVVWALLNSGQPTDATPLQGSLDLVLMLVAVFWSCAFAAPARARHGLWGLGSSKGALLILHDALHDAASRQFCR
jgi:hypothetical protein